MCDLTTNISPKSRWRSWCTHPNINLFWLLLQVLVSEDLLTSGGLASKIWHHIEPIWGLEQQDPCKNSLKHLGNHLASQGYMVVPWPPMLRNLVLLRPVLSETACDFLKCMFGWRHICVAPRSYKLFQGRVSFRRLNTSPASVFNSRDALSWSQQSDLRILRDALLVLPPRWKLRW